MKLDREVQEILNNNPGLIADHIRSQLFRGRAASGEYISPKYSEDSYFKSRAAAERYASFKQQTTPHPDRPRDVPNLYINGFFHSGITAKVYNGKIYYDNRVSNAASVESHYGGSRYLYGINPDTAEDLRHKIYRPLIQRIQLKAFRS